MKISKIGTKAWQRLVGVYNRHWNYSHIRVYLVSKSVLDLGMLVRKLKLH